MLLHQRDRARGGFVEDRFDTMLRQTPQVDSAIH
jgi:hypothetical protein